MHGAGGSVLDALFVGGGEVRAEVGPRFVGGDFLVPVAKIEAEDARIGEDLMKFAEQGGFRDGIAAGLGDSLSEDGAAPQRFHAFGRFPRSVERGHVFVELGLVQCTVRVIEVLEDRYDRDVGVSVERVLEGAEVRGSRGT